MIGIATKGAFGGAIDVQYVVAGTDAYVIDPTSLSFEVIYNNLKAWVDARPDAAVWKDFFAAGGGITMMELLAGISTFLAFRIIGSRKESYLQYAEMLSSCIAVSQNLGYSVNRGTNKHLTLTILPDITIALEKYDIVGSVLGSDLVLSEGVGLTSGVEIAIDVIVGDKKTETAAISSDELQWFRFIATLVSEDFRLLLNDIEVPTSTEARDLLNDKYVTLSNAYGAIDVVYMNSGDYEYTSGDVLTLEYIEIATPDFSESDLTCDYGSVVSLDETVAVEEAESTVAIKINAPLYHETQLLIRGRDDYEKTFKLLNSDFTSTNGYDASAAVVDLTYVLDTLNYLTTVQKAAYITSLSSYRPFGVQPPTISDPIRVYFTLNITVTLLTPTVAAQVESDVDIVIAEYEELLEKEVDLEAIEYALENYDYTKIARVAVNVSTWNDLTFYERGSFVKATDDTGFDYEATDFTSDVSAEIIAVAADDLLNDEGFSLFRNDGTEVVFKFSKDAGVVTDEDVTISITSGETDDEVAALIVDAINTVGAFSASAATFTVTVVRKEGGTAYRTTDETVVNSTFSVSDFEGHISAGVEPSGWPVTAGDTIIDNDIEWTCRVRGANLEQLAWNEFCTIETNVVVS